MDCRVSCVKDDYVDFITRCIIKLEWFCVQQVRALFPVTLYNCFSRLIKLFKYV